MWASGSEWLLVILVVVLLFGAKKIPELAKNLGKSLGAFREGMNEADKESKPVKKSSATALKKTETTKKTGSTPAKKAPVKQAKKVAAPKKTKAAPAKKTASVGKPKKAAPKKTKA